MAFDSTASSPTVAEGRVLVHDLSQEGMRERGPLLDSLLDRFAEKYDGWDAADPAQDGPRVLLEVTIGRWLMRS